MLIPGIALETSSLLVIPFVELQGKGWAILKLLFGNVSFTLNSVSGGGGWDWLFLTVLFVHFG